MHAGKYLSLDETRGFATESVEISIDALRALFSTHKHLLNSKDSAARSLDLMHGG